MPAKQSHPRSITGRLLVAGLLLLSAPVLAADGGLTIGTSLDAKQGHYIVDGDGRALYSYSKDQRGQGSEEAKSHCTKSCTLVWPPVIVPSAPEVKGAAEQGLVGTIERSGGELQATYAGWPLYRYVGDTDKDLASGAGVRSFKGEWHLVAANPDARGGDKAVSFDGLDLKAPECVRHDSKRDWYLVSNVNGEMRDADDNGFISLVTGGGSSELRWIAGGQKGVTLHAPKGMEIAGDRLYVADIDHLRIFDAAVGKSLNSIRIEGAKFLNDVAVAEDGTVFVTDTGTTDIPGAIYRVDPDGTVEKIAGGPDLHRPNGIDFALDGSLVVATFASDQVMVLSREGEKRGSVSVPTGSLDGLVVDGSTVLVSSWNGRRLLRVARGGKAETVVTGLQQPACFGIDWEHGLLLIPQVGINKVAVVPFGEG